MTLQTAAPLPRVSYRKSDITRSLIYEQATPDGTFEQLLYFLPPVTVTPVQVHPVQAPVPQTTTTSYPLLATAPEPEMVLRVRPVMGIPEVGVPPSRSPPS